MIVFLDFDGTITRRDATDAILEAYADPEWLDIEDDWKAGRISSRECLSAQMALVTATPDEINVLLDSVEIDEGLVPLLDTCSAAAVPVHVLSDGFGYCIERILSRPGLVLGARLDGVQIVCSHLEPRGSRWHTRFGSFPACTHGCATCKPTTMNRLSVGNGQAVFVGDGLSDKYAVTSADQVFAKDQLAVYCSERAIPYFPYENLATVARWVEERMRDNRRPDP